MICPNCHSNIEKQTNFCPECGYDFVNKSAHTNCNINEKWYIKKWYIIGAILFVIAVLWNYTPSNKIEKNHTSSGSPSTTTTAAKNDNRPNTKTTTDTPVELNTAFVVDGYGEITIQRVDFTDDVSPDKPGRFYSHYVADQDKVYLSVTATVRNMQKKAVEASDVAKVDILYDTNEYEYHCMSVLEKGGDLRPTFYSIDPLNPEKIKYIVQMPSSVQNNGNPIKIRFTMGAKKFVYSFR